MKDVILLVKIILLTTVFNSRMCAQVPRDTLSFDDIRMWRTHTATLSDNGEWYTIRYSLIDEPETETDTAKYNYVKQRFEQYYGENNKTDVLYICHFEEGVKYEISDGRNPVFSTDSDWIAYQIENDSKEPEDDSGDKEVQNIIELKHLSSNFTVRDESEANYTFPEDKNYFITSDENSLLVFDLDRRKEHYIGNIGEYLVDKKSEFIIYTILTEDKRGNGIYQYDPRNKTTRALHTGNFLFSNLSWNTTNNSIAAYKYNEIDEEVDFRNMNIVVISGIDGESVESKEYPVREIQGFPENMGPAVRFGNYSNEINWSNDDQRLFLKIKEYDQGKDNKEDDSNESDEKSDVQIWHWNDELLFSERITEEENNKNEVFEAIFFQSSNSLIQLTGEEIQELIWSKETDNWAIGKDNRKYLTDWDIARNDLYLIDLSSGTKKLIEENYMSSYWTDVLVSPDGTKAILWDTENYWCYSFEQNSKINISEAVDVSFVNKEYDMYGFTPDWGFEGWVKDQNAIIVNHNLDLWLLPLDNESEAQNLTSSVTSIDSIRFSFQDANLSDEDDLEDRYIDLNSPNILFAENLKTKYAGYYNLQSGQLSKLIYEPVRLSSSWLSTQLIKSEKSDVIIYKKGDYLNYPESHLTTLDFSNSKKLTNTNPQQKMFNWGRRILIDYTNDDGVPLQGILSIPDSYKEGEKLPMIVYSYEKLSHRMYQYATPYLSGTTVPEMMYVSDGYLFLQPDIHFNVGTPHSDMHECIDAAIAKVIELGYVDEQRIGYEGFSFGGHCGMYISTQENRFAAIAAGAGVSNLVQGFNIDIVWDGSNEQDYYMTGQGRLGTDPTSNIDMYVSESAVFNANTMNTPLLLFHGTGDKIVQWEHSFGFYSILRYLKKPVIFLSYPGEGHGLRNKESTRLDVQKRLKEYFDHHLKGAELKRWMNEDFPIEMEAMKEKKEDKRTLPKWK